MKTLVAMLLLGTSFSIFAGEKAEDVTIAERTGIQKQLMSDGVDCGSEQAKMLAEQYEGLIDGKDTAIEE